VQLRDITSMRGQLLLPETEQCPSSKAQWADKGQTQKAAHGVADEEARRAWSRTSTPTR